MGQEIVLDQQKLMAAAMKLLTENPMFKVGEADIRGNTYRVFENAPPNMAAFFAYGASHGDKEFLIYEGERYTFAETWKRANRFAHALRDGLGVKPGDRVGLAMRNYPEWIFAYMGIISTGAVVVPLNAWWKAEELRYGIEDSGAKIVVVDGRRLDFIGSLKSRLA